MRTTPLSLLLLALACALPGCDVGQRGGAVIVSAIGSRGELVEPLLHNDTAAARIILGETAQGLVSHDATGEVVPALAQRWIVTDDGRSYIFRLRRARWADGEHVDAREVAKQLSTRIRKEAKDQPYTNAAAVTEVLAMTTDVIEIRLNSARPNFLAMLAQPHIAIARRSGGTGPYRKSWHGDALTLTPAARTGEGLVDPDVMPEQTRIVRAERSARAIIRFTARQSDLVLGGTLADLPLARAARVNDRAFRIDPTRGLFGLAISERSDLLGDAGMRSALSMAIDRIALLAQLDAVGWKATDSLTPPLVNLPHAPSRPDWAGADMDRRRAMAAATVSAWRTEHGGATATVTIKANDTPGHRMFRALLAQDLARVGIRLVPVDKDADLRLIDEVAPYDSAFWYLARLSCARKLSCDPQGDELLKQAAATQDQNERLRLLGEAEVLIARHGGFIPIANPLRWSLVSPRLTGFQPSALAIHPLGKL